jgi:hypothetical protein
MEKKQKSDLRVLRNLILCLSMMVCNFARKHYWILQLHNPKEIY